MYALEVARRNAGMSQAELARRTRIDRSYVNKAERKGWAYPGHLKRYAEVLGWEREPAELMREVEV